MRKLLISVLFLLVRSFAVQAGELGATFILENGNVVSFSLQEKPVISLSDGELVVTVSGKPVVSYPYNQVRRALISSDYIESAMSKVYCAPSKVIFKYFVTDQILKVSGLACSESIILYSAESGKLMIKKKADSDGFLQMSLSEMPKGVYVVTSAYGSFGYKLFKQ